jgi:hypothetical protein
MPTTLIAPAISIPLRTATCPDAWNTGAAKREGEAEEDVPGHDVNALEHRWLMPVEEVLETVNRVRVDPPDDGELH